ncbi:MAG: methyltransferase, partial [Gemmatimonadaceae bacterium]
LASILSKYAGVRGVLFDLPQATTEASALLNDRRVAERVTTEHGSFFDGVPAGGGVYILSHIIHDWSDEQSLAILKRCRASMKNDSRLLLIELVLNEEGVSGFGSADLVMMTLLGGAERTTSEYAELFSRAGLKLSRVVRTTTSASIIEAVCA